MRLHRPHTIGYDGQWNQYTIHPADFLLRNITRTIPEKGLVL